MSAKEAESHAVGSKSKSCLCMG